MEETCLSFLQNYVPDARIHASFFEAIKSGVVLCKLVNAIVPDAILKIDERKNPFVYGANHEEFLNYLSSINIPKCVHYTTQNLVEGNENAVSNCISCIVAFANQHKIDLDSKPVEKKKLEGEGVFGDLEEIKREQEEIRRKEEELLEQQRMQEEKEAELNAMEQEAERELEGQMQAELERQKRELKEREDSLRYQFEEQEAREESLRKEQEDMARKANEEEIRAEQEALHIKEETERIRLEELENIEEQKRRAAEELQRLKDEAERLKIEAAEKLREEQEKSRLEELLSEEMAKAEEMKHVLVEDDYAMEEKLTLEKIEEVAIEEAPKEEEKPENVEAELVKEEQQETEENNDEIEEIEENSGHIEQKMEVNEDSASEQLHQRNQTNSISDEPFDEEIKSISFKEAPPRQPGEDTPDRVFFEPPSRFLKTYKCNVAVLGTEEVGKAAICQRFETGEFDEDSKKQEFYFRKFAHTVNDQPANVELSLKITDDMKYLKECQFVFVVFAHNDHKSFKGVSKFIKLADKAKVEDVIVIGNKADEKEGGISMEDIEKFTDKLKKHNPKAKYVSTSCVKGFGIRELVESLDFRTSGQ